MVSNLEDKKLIYTLLAIFQMAGAGSTRKLCELAEEATGEAFSTEALEEVIVEIREISLKEKVELEKIIQKFVSTIKLSNMNLVESTERISEKVEYSINELEKMLKHAEEQCEKTVNPEDVKYWRERIKELQDLIENEGESQVQDG